MAKKVKPPKCLAPQASTAPPVKPSIVSRMKDIPVGPVARPAGSMLKKPPKEKK